MEFKSIWTGFLMKRSLGSIPQRSEDSEPGGKRAKRSAAGVMPANPTLAGRPFVVLSSNDGFVVCLDDFRYLIWLSGSEGFSSRQSRRRATPTWFAYSSHGDVGSQDADLPMLSCTSPW